jgi:hypothetical protein
MASKSAADSPANEQATGGATSRTGRFVVFFSTATNLHPDATSGASQVYRKDLATGSLSLVSANEAGQPAIAGAFGGAVTPDARWMTFVSLQLDATDLTPSILDIYQKNFGSGQVQIASASATGLQADAHCFGGNMSDDGRFVAFQSAASNLVPNETNPGIDVFVKDMQTGAIFRASDRPDGQVFSGDVTGALISGDGRRITFQTTVALVPSDTHIGNDVYLKDLESGKLSLVSVSATGESPNREVFDFAGASADCRFVGFTSSATNLVPGDTNLVVDVFIKDTRTGAVVRATTSSTGELANQNSAGSGISADGRFVLFRTAATNLGWEDQNDNKDVYLKDLLTGECTLVSINLSGHPAGTNQPGSLSDDGSVATFASVFDNITPEPTVRQQVFARGTGLVSGAATTLSLLPTGLFIGQKRCSPLHCAIR